MDGGRERRREGGREGGRVRQREGGREGGRVRARRLFLSSLFSRAVSGCKRRLVESDHSPSSKRPALDTASEGSAAVEAATATKQEVGVYIWLWLYTNFDVIIWL